MKDQDYSTARGFRIPDILKHNAVSPAKGLSETDLELPLYSGRRDRSRSRRNLLIIFATLCALGLFSRSNILYGNTLQGDHPNTGSTGSRNPAYLIQVKHGAVASENERCSIIGVNVLKDGGNAVDSAISAALCTGVVNMFS